MRNSLSGSEIRYISNETPKNVAGSIQYAQVQAAKKDTVRPWIKANKSQLKRKKIGRVRTKKRLRRAPTGRLLAERLIIIGFSALVILLSASC